MIALIPTVGEAWQLPTLVDRLLAEGVDQVLLTVNENPPPKLPLMNGPRVAIIPLSGSIYAGWNFGIRYARANDVGGWVALLNDDLELAPGALVAAARYIDDDPTVAVVGLDYRSDAPEAPTGLRKVSGTFRHDGVHGCALLVDANKVREVDEDFEWWYGDDDLVFKAEQDGWSVALAEGCRVTHQGEATAVKREWTHMAKIRDRQRFIEKWGDR